MNDCSQPITGQFSLSEVAQIDEAIAAFPRTFGSRESFVRFCVMSGLDGFVHDALLAEQNVITDREGNSTPASSNDRESGASTATDSPEEGKS